MNLVDFPRPPQDNGRGIHWSPSQYQWGKADWELWATRVLDMKIKWITALVPADDNANELSKRIIDLGVMPIIRFYGSKEPTVAGGNIMGRIGQLIDIGVRYFQLKNENDSAFEREGGQHKSGWEVTDAQNIIVEAREVMQMGGIYCIYAYNTGNSEPRNAIQIIKDEGGEDVLRASALCIHNYAKGRPIAYPNDTVRMFGTECTSEEYFNQLQPESWSAEMVREITWKNQSIEQITDLRAAQANPNITIHEDFTCFRMFEYWSQLYVDLGLPAPPIVGGESGWEVEDAHDDWYPNPTALKHSVYSKHAVGFMQGNTPIKIFNPDHTTYDLFVPDNVFTMTYWLMGEKVFGWDTSGQWETGSWYTDLYNDRYELQGKLPIIDALIQLPEADVPRHEGNVPPSWDARKHLFPPSYVEFWDSRLIYIDCEIKQMTSGDKIWKVLSGQWQDTIGELQTYAQGYIFIKVLDAQGVPIENAQILVTRPDATDTVFTKGEVDGYLANYRMTGQRPVYSVKVGQSEFPSDIIDGIGLGRESSGEWDPTTYVLTFQLMGGDGTEPPVEPEVCPTCGKPL